MVLEIEFRQPTSLPIELPILNFPPQQSNAKQTNGKQWLSGQKVLVGNSLESFADVFRIQSSDSRNGRMQLFFSGDFSNVHWIGAGLTEGKVTVEGNAGNYIGAQMGGGEIVVRGNAGHWVAAENEGGKITIDGNCGDHLAASLPGKNKGGGGGTVLVQGNVGNGTARRMRRGTVAIAGDAGDANCWQMLAGTVIFGGKILGHLGGQMKRGTLICNQAPESGILPSYSPTIRSPQPIWRLIHQFMRNHWQINWLPPIDSFFECFCGDVFHEGRGEIWLAS